MHSSVASAKLIMGNPSGTEMDTSPILIELSKKAHFCRFLEKELHAARTEAEKEAVQTILLKTKIEIRAMQKKWKRTQAALHRTNRTASKRVANAYSTRRIQ